MRKTIVLFIFLALSISCGSSRNFQSFYNQHKNDVGVTAFQVPNFMKTLLATISPEMGGLFNNIQDFKFITFKEVLIQTHCVKYLKKNSLTNSLGNCSKNIKVLV